VFTQTVEYALRAVAHLSQHHPAARTASQIAVATHVPSDYLSKVLKDLAREGVVRSRRGLHGGFTLVKPPERLTVYEVVHALAPIQRIERCPLGLRAHANGRLCPLHRLLDDALGAVEYSLRAVTLQDLSDSAADRSPLGAASSRLVPIRVRTRARRRSKPRLTRQ
jgi:Rrf2 family protein